MKTASASSTMTWLGYGGLIPFVLPTLLVVADHSQAQLWEQIASVYAFGIICFLTGSWWGFAIREQDSRALLLSNGYFLTAFAIFLFASDWWGLAAAVLLMAMFFAEQNSKWIPVPGEDYQRLRIRLTVVACVCMLTLHGIDV